MDQKINTHDLNMLPGINWTQLSELGLVRKINEEILHPLGLAISYNAATGLVLK